jgi:hypothetical protein
MDTGKPGATVSKRRCSAAETVMPPTCTTDAPYLPRRATESTSSPGTPIDKVPSSVTSGSSTIRVPAGHSIHPAVVRMRHQTRSIVPERPSNSDVVDTGTIAGSTSAKDPRHDSACPPSNDTRTPVHGTSPRD